MHWIDWLIMMVPLIVCSSIAFYSRQYVRSVADFMAGGRNAGRYLICVARGEQGSGAASYVAAFQVILAAGFTLNWFSQISVPITLIVTILGFVIYRYRQTRVMTVGQFFEIRYSRKFRLFAGVLGFAAGLVNFGIIPVIGAQFMVYFLELPQSIHLLGMNVPTHLILMGTFLTACVIMTTTGGQVSVLLTDCAEGMISQVFYVFITICVLVMFFKWSDTQAVLLHAEHGKSLVNPFDTKDAKDFNLWYVFISLFLANYRVLAWQNSHAFSSSAASPHEARMGGVLGRWRLFANTVMIALLAICAMVYLKSPEGMAATGPVLSQISDPATRDQMRAPVALTHMLPMGVKGALLSICLMGIIAGDGIHLHSWGSIFIQDVVMPLRRKPLSPAQHIRLLRLSVVGVAVWAFLFGAVFPQIKYVQFWWGVTEAIFVSGAGVAIIAGLYWSRGTTAAAWTALILGSTIAVSGITWELYVERVLHQEFILNGFWIAVIAKICAITAYITVSLLTCRQPHDMDKLLHRGRYAIAGDAVPAAAGKKRSLIYRVLMFGIDEHFSRTDRWITIGITVWGMFWFFVVAIGSITYLIHPWSDAAWAKYWLWAAIYLPLAIGVFTTIWFTTGCTHDIIVFLRRLKEQKTDVHDDGSVAQETQKESLVVPEAVPARR